MWKYISGWCLTLGLVVLPIAGCGGTKPASDNQGATAAAKPTVDVSKPAKVTIFAPDITDDMFKIMVAEPMAKKYPQITMERPNGKLNDLIAAGETPDLITDWNGAIPSYQQSDVLMDMTPLVKRNNFDLSRFQDIYINAIKKFSDKGELMAIPYYVQLNALYYNKNLFDKFGVPYPKDGMTWNDAIELAKRVTRNENDVQIQGLNYDGVNRLAFPFSPTVVNVKTNKADVNNEVWKRAFEYAKRLDSIPGNYPKQPFIKGQVAMYAGTGDLLSQFKKTVGDGTFNIGVAQYPQFKEAPNTYGMVDAHYIFVTKTSKNQDAAMKVIEAMTSDEVQMVLAKQYARLSPLKDPELQKQFGSDFLPGVNMQSIFKSKPAAGQVFSKYYPKARDTLNDEYNQVAENKKDINTALRDAETRINKLIEDDGGTK